MLAASIALGCTALYVALVLIFRRLGAAANLSLGESWRHVAIACLLCLGSLMAGLIGPEGALTVGLGLNVFLGVRFSIAVRRGLRLKGLAEGLVSKDPAVASAALEGLEKEIASILRMRGEPDIRARWVLTIASTAIMAGHRERALAWTLRINPRRLSGEIRAMHAQIEAALRIGMNDLARAREALARADRPAPGPWEDALRAHEALLEALEGDAQAAASQAAQRLEARPTGHVKATWQTVRAHALAKLGDTEEARRMLLAIRAEWGDGVVRRVVAHAGPASQLAESVIADGGAYR
jgi:hypothetical protein